MTDTHAPAPDSSQTPNNQEKPPLLNRTKRILFGKPRDLSDKSIFHRIALLPFLAWVGLGADGLSSSSYGPEEAFRTLGDHAYLALGLGTMTAITVFLIAAAYSKLIEDFPHGGGGYIVASKLLSPKIGVISGSALLVDYVMTITVSIASAGDALFSFLPLSYHAWKLPVVILTVVALTTINIRGVRESVLILTPIFLAFIATHIVLILGGIFAHVPELPATVQHVSTSFNHGFAALGLGGMFLLFIHAYSMGGGTYTGIEAVSNGLPIMQEPRVHTAKRTMLYMAISLAFTASGLLVCYVLWNVGIESGKTLNAVLVEKVTKGIPFGGAFVILTLISEGALLIVGATGRESWLTWHWIPGCLGSFRLYLIGSPRPMESS